MPMKIFFAGSIRGGREYAACLHTYSGNAQETGHEVVSEHVASVDLKRSKPGSLMKKYSIMM